MAYQVRQRDPLLDQNMQITLARRGREGLGVLMVLFGVLLAVILLTYNPEDPNWLAATDAPPRNWLGVFGTALPDPWVWRAGPVRRSDRLGPALCPARRVGTCVAARVVCHGLGSDPVALQCIAGAGAGVDT